MILAIPFMFLIIVISSFILSTLKLTLTIQHNGINSGSILRSITRKDFRDVAFPHYLISGLHKLAGAGRRGAVDSSENGRILIYFVFLVLKRRHPDILISVEAGAVLLWH